MPEIIDNTLSRNSVLVAIGVVVVAGIIGVVTSPANTVNILGFCTLVCASLFGLMKVDAAAKKVEEVKDTLAVATASVKSQAAAGEMKLDGMVQKIDATHSLVNSAHGYALKTIAVLVRKEADRTGKIEDIKAAEEAENVSAQHEAAQARSDTKPNSEIQKLSDEVKDTISQVKDVVKEMRGKP